MISARCGARRPIPTSPAPVGPLTEIIAVAPIAPAYFLAWRLPSTTRSHVPLGT